MKRYCTDEMTREVVDADGVRHRERFRKTWSVGHRSEKFLIAFDCNISWLYDIKSIVTIKVLFKLLGLLSVGDGSISLNRSKRQKICEELRIAKSSFFRSLRELVDIGVITGGSDEYVVNADMFWRGGRDTRRRLLDDRKPSVSVVVDDMPCGFVDPSTGEILPDGSSE